jgi:hypothetical protein
MNYKCLTGIISFLLISTPLPSAALNKKIDYRKLLEKRNVLALPSLASQAGSYTYKTHSIKSLGEAPTLQTLASSPIKNVFWGDIDGVNVIDAINNDNFGAQYCGEFFSAANGKSGGLGACHMAESVGYSYKEIIQSGTILCYIQNAPTKANLKAGGITLESGKFPPGGIEQTFSVPAGQKSRIIKIKFTNLPLGYGPTDIFLEVLSSKANKAGKNAYKLNLWQCAPGAEHPSNLDTITITNAFNYISTHGGVENFEGQLASGTAQKTAGASGALIKQKNELVWDTSSNRIATSTYKDTDGSFFKSQIEITKDNTIKVKQAQQFYSASQKGIVITNYTGDSAESLRFLSGAFKEIDGGPTIVNAAKYNGDFYEVDQGNSLLPSVVAEDLESEYYTSGVTDVVDTSMFSCNVTPDLTVSVDHSNSSVYSSIARCDLLGLIFENTYFCHEDPEVMTAEQKATDVCSQ